MAGFQVGGARVVAWSGPGAMGKFEVGNVKSETRMVLLLNESVNRQTVACQ